MCESRRLATQQTLWSRVHISQTGVSARSLSSGKKKLNYSCDYNLKYLLVPGMSEEGYCPVLHSKFATAEGLRQIIFFDVRRCNKGSAPEARLWQFKQCPTQSALRRSPFKPRVTVHSRRDEFFLPLSFAFLLVSTHQKRTETSFEALCYGDRRVSCAVRRHWVVVERQQKVHNPIVVIGAGDV